VFCDIDEQTLTLDVSAVQAAITERTSAVLGVYVYGMLCEVAGLDKVGKAHQLKILYDAAHAFGTDIDGRAVATYDDATMFSFHATKFLHTVEGGALVANDAAMKYQVDLLKNFGIGNETEVMLPGLNAKFNEVQLSIGLANLEYYDSE
jgi:dTDP-4-amino-4,6-dideoxygalactose transaminase